MVSRKIIWGYRWAIVNPSTPRALLLRKRLEPTGGLGGYGNAELFEM